MFFPQVTDFIEQRIAYDYCGEENTLSNDPKLSHWEFLQSRGKSVWGRENVVQRVSQNKSLKNFRYHLFIMAYQMKKKNQMY